MNNSDIKVFVVLNGHMFHIVRLLEYLQKFNFQTNQVKIAVYYDEKKSHSMPEYINFLENAGLFNSKLWCIKRTKNPFRLLLSKRAISREIMKWFSVRTCTDLVLGNYSSEINLNIANKLIAKNLVFLDEGNSTIGIAEKRLNNFQYRSLFVRTILALILNYKISVPKSVTFFTSYSFIKLREEDSVIRCDFSFFKSKFLYKTVDLNVLIILGCPLVEFGYMDQANYIKNIMQIKNYFGSSKTCYYMPHHDESCENVNRITVLGLILVESKLPIEIFLNSMDKNPKYVCAFVSTAFDTLIDVLPQSMMLKSFYISKNDFIRYPVGWSRVYDEYRTNSYSNFELVDDLSNKNLFIQNG